MPGKGKLTITGQLGDVMKESAQAALSYVRGHADLPEDWFATHDLHVHVPAGAIPKDGPSAGITMATALMSLVTGRPVRDDVAMTGELTLTGQVLPIGGLKEKALAAQRAGVKRVLAPSRNEPDLEDIPEALREDSTSCGSSEIGDVFDAALVNGRPGYARRARQNLKASRGGSDGEQEGAEGREGGSVGPLQPVRPAAHRGRGPAAEHRPGVRVGPRRLRAAEQRQEPGEADLRGQEAAEAHQGDRRQRPRRRASASTRRPRSRSAAAAASAACCCSASSAARVALALSEGLRKKVLDALFGAEEEFEYTSTTSHAIDVRRARPPRPVYERAPTGALSRFVGCSAWTSTSIGLCLGGNVFGWTADRDASFAVLDAYVEAGGNFIDTADTYMRPNMGISETIIGEWMAARGNRDQLVIATKVGSDGGLSAAQHRRARRGVAARGCRPTGSTSTTRTRTTGRRAGRGDRARVRRAGARRARCCTSPPSNMSGERLVESLRARRARGPGRLRSGCSRTTTWSSARATSASTRRSSRAHGLDVAPYYALASGLPDRQVPQRRADGGLAAGGARVALPGRARRGACWPRWTRSPPRTACRSPPSPSPGCWPSRA